MTLLLIAAKEAKELQEQYSHLDSWVYWDTQSALPLPLLSGLAFTSVGIPHWSDWLEPSNSFYWSDLDAAETARTAKRHDEMLVGTGLPPINFSDASKYIQRTRYYLEAVNTFAEEIVDSGAVIMFWPARPPSAGFELDVHSLTRTLEKQISVRVKEIRNASSNADNFDYLGTARLLMEFASDKAASVGTPPAKAVRCARSLLWKLMRTPDIRYRWEDGESRGVFSSWPPKLLESADAAVATIASLKHRGVENIVEVFRATDSLTTVETYIEAMDATNDEVQAWSVIKTLVEKGEWAKLAWALVETGRYSEEISFDQDAVQKAIIDLDGIDPYRFEELVAHLLRQSDFDDAEVMGGSGDLGVDVLAEKDGQQYAVQVKRYSSPVSRRAVSDAVAGKEHYGCAEAMVVTNSTFTAGAKKLARSTGCRLVEGDELKSWLRESNGEWSEHEELVVHGEVTLDASTLDDLLNRLVAQRKSLEVAHVSKNWDRVRGALDEVRELEQAVKRMLKDTE